MKHWIPGAVTLACDELKEKIRGKKVALMMNTTALDNEGRLLVDVMVQEKWAEFPFFFGMEHGVRGNFYAGDENLTDIDEKTGLKVINLFDAEKYPRFQPPVELVKQVDAVVFSAQDVGVRHWTYTPWLLLLLESCAEAGKELIILDRPNPIRGDIVEGAPAESKYAGANILSRFEYPLRHGMTVGELALMYNDTKGFGCNVTVLKMKGWRRDMWYEDTGLVWVPGSPNMQDTDTPLFFAATGLMQSANFSLGIGTTTPFEYIGYPTFDGDKLAQELNSRDLPGVYFTPKFYMAMTYENPSEVERKMKLCDGVLIQIYDRNVWRPVTTQLHIMDAVNKLFPDMVNFEVDVPNARPRMCTDLICDALKKGESLLPIIELWEQGAEEFKKAREKYLLY